MFNFVDTSIVLDIWNFCATVFFSAIGTVIAWSQVKNEKREKKVIAEIEQNKLDSLENLKTIISSKESLEKLQEQTVDLQKNVKSILSSFNIIEFYDVVSDFVENTLDEFIKLDKKFSSLLEKELPMNSKYYTTFQSQLIYDLYKEYRNNCRPELFKLSEKTIKLASLFNEKITDFENEDVLVEEKIKMVTFLRAEFLAVVNCFDVCVTRYNNIIEILYIFEKTF